MFTPTHTLFEAGWYNYGSGTTESAFLHGMVQVAVGTYKREAGDETGMRSLFRTAGQYLRRVPDDFYGTDVDDVRSTLSASRDDPGTLQGWQLSLDGARPEAREADFTFVEGLD